MAGTECNYDQGALSTRTNHRQTQTQAQTQTQIHGHDTQANATELRAPLAFVARRGSHKQPLSLPPCLADMRRSLPCRALMHSLGLQILAAALTAHRWWQLLLSIRWPRCAFWIHSCPCLTPPADGHVPTTQHNWCRRAARLSGGAWDASKVRRLWTRHAAVLLQHARVGACGMRKTRSPRQLPQLRPLHGNTRPNTQTHAPHTGMPGHPSKDMKIPQQLSRAWGAAFPAPVPRALTRAPGWTPPRMPARTSI